MNLKPRNRSNPIDPIKLTSNIKQFMKRNHPLITEHRSLFPVQDLTPLSTQEEYRAYKRAITAVRIKFNIPTPFA